MATTVGNMGGIPNKTLRSSGGLSPTKRPNGPPITKPASKTGRCMGKRAPKAGTCAVRKGMISPKATNKPAKTTCRVDARTIIFSPYPNFCSVDSANLRKKEVAAAKPRLRVLILIQQLIFKSCSACKSLSV